MLTYLPAVFFTDGGDGGGGGGGGFKFFGGLRLYGGEYNLFTALSLFHFFRNGQHPEK